MSAHNRPAELSSNAQIDLQDILAFTVETWGQGQAIAYKSILDRAIMTISHNPYIGKARPDLGDRLRSYQVNRHVIYFRVDNERVRIERVLHVRMDASTALEP